MPRFIQSVLIAGGGVTAWMVAAALKRNLPGITVTVVDTDAGQLATSELYGGTTPAILDFHANLRLDERNLLACTGSLFRLGLHLAGWTEKGKPYVRAFGEVGTKIDTAAFHQMWLRAAGEGDVPDFGSFSLAAALAQAGRFLPLAEIPSPGLPAYEYALLLDPPLYRDYLRAYAMHNGVQWVRETGGLKVVAEGDRIKEVRTSAASLTADLYVDCSGSAATLFGELESGRPFESWSHWLSCDRIQFADASPQDNPPPCDRATAVENGWVLEAPLRRRLQNAHIFSSRHPAGSVLNDPQGPSPTPLHQGRRSLFWVGNCVAIGESAVTLEPLGAPYLDLVCRQINHMLAYMPDAEFAPVELAEFNSKAIDDADSARDLVLVHYLLSSRSEAFWRDASCVPVPGRLQRLVRLFFAHGKIAGVDGLHIDIDTWLSIFFGQGAIPGHHDPMADAVPLHLFHQASDMILQLIKRAVGQAPTQRRYVEHLLSAAAR